MKFLFLILVIILSQKIYAKGATLPDDPFRLDKPYSYKVGVIYQDYYYLPKPPTGFDWKLWFSDEFNGTTINTTKWQHSCKKCPRRYGYWRNDGAAVDGKGSLLIKAFKDGNDLISGALETLPTIKFKYGFYIAKVKTQNHVGMWSAFWLWPFNADAKGAVEMDAFEYGFTPFAGQNALHWYQGGHREKTNLWLHEFSDEWHTFGILYTPEQIVFYKDGKVKWSVRSEPTDTHYTIIFSTEIGEWAWGQKLNLDLLPEGIKKKMPHMKLPDAWYVDWVRYYNLTPKK